MIDKLKKLADIEAKRQGVRIAIVNDSGKVYIRRYDWLCDAMSRESRYIISHGGKNVFRNIIIEYVSQ